jgi:hypothetical protein
MEHVLIVAESARQLRFVPKRIFGEHPTLPTSFIEGSGLAAIVEP